MEHQEQLNNRATEQNTEQTLSEYLRGRFGADAPRIELTFLSGFHGNETDSENIRADMKKADIYIPENRGWTEETLTKMKEISARERYPYEIRVTNKFFEPVLEALYDTQTPVTIIDVPKDVDDEMRKKLQIFVPSSEMSFEENLEHLSESVKSWAEVLDKEREQYMISVIGPRIAEILEEHPELLEKEKVNVLLTLGVAHTGIKKELAKDKDTDVKEKLTHSPLSFQYFDDMTRRNVFGKEISDTVKENALLETILIKTRHLKEARRNIQSTPLQNRFARTLTGAFTSAELREIFKEWQSGKDFNQLFQKRMEAKGFKIPNNDEEAEEILKNYKNDKRTNF